MNVTLAETHFQLGQSRDELPYDRQQNEIGGATSKNESYYNQATRSQRASLIQDIFVTCSIERDRSYALAINLELDNPFKVIDVYYESSGLSTRQHAITQQRNQTVQEVGRRGLFRISLPQSSLLVQLNQRIRYDDCLRVNYVQLSPTVNYELECVDCSASDREFLDKVFKRRMSQLDAELDAILSEKIRFGLQALLSLQRLDLDTYLD